ncbi:MAG: GNAT family N-acetyltransferase [Planctomycetota bacterium]
MDNLVANDGAIRLRLRPMLGSDYDVIRAIENEPEGNAMACAHARTDDQFAAHWRRMLEEADTINRVIETATRTERGAVTIWTAVGFIGSFVTDVFISSDAVDDDGAPHASQSNRGTARRCVGYRISKDNWGKGLATRALGLFLKEIPERPLWAVTAASNTASQRVLTKCGFQAVDRRWAEATERYPAGDEVVARLG